MNVVLGGNLNGAGWRACLVLSRDPAVNLLGDMAVVTPFEDCFRTVMARSFLRVGCDGQQEAMLIVVVQVLENSQRFIPSVIRLHSFDLDLDIGRYVVDGKELLCAPIPMKKVGGTWKDGELDFWMSSRNECLPVSLSDDFLRELPSDVVKTGPEVENQVVDDARTPAIKRSRCHDSSTTSVLVIEVMVGPCRVAFKVAGDLRIEFLQVFPCPLDFEPRPV